MVLNGYQVLIVGLLLCVAWHIYDEWIVKVPLTDFGMASVERILKWERAEFRNQILKRGWMTRAQWQQLNRSQLKTIDDELKRRQQLLDSDAKSK